MGAKVTIKLVDIKSQLSHIKPKAAISYANPQSFNAYLDSNSLDQ